MTPEELRSRLHEATGSIQPPASSYEWLRANLTRRRRTALAGRLGAGVIGVAMAGAGALALQPAGDPGPSVLYPTPAPTATASPSATPSTPASPAPSSPAPSATPVPPGGTRVISYSPYRSDGRLAPGVDVVAEAPATCWASFLSRDDAYRCAVDEGHELRDGQNMFDPCFRNPRNAAELVCPRSPRGDRAMRIRQPRFDDTNREPDHGDGSAWYVELADGQRCWLLSGASTTYDGKRANYQCPDGVLFGDPDRSTPRWTVHFAKSYRPASRGDLKVVAITTAWF